MHVPVTVNVPAIPCAAFSFGYEGGCLGEVYFTNESSNGNGIWLWDFGDGTTSSAFETTHLYAEAGIYTVTLTAGSGAQSSTVEFEVEVSPVNVTFISTDPNANNGNVDFASTTSGSLEWLWTFGDGSISTEEHPNHTYSNFGTYIVTLFATDEFGCDGFTTDTIEYGIDGIKDSELFNLMIYPNPTSGVLNISGINKDMVINAELYDLSGKLVQPLGRLNEQNNAFNIEGLSSGVYVLKLSSDTDARHIRIVHH